MNIVLYIKWEHGMPECYCHPLRKCEHKQSCEYMEIPVNTYDGMRECMDSNHTYCKVNGRVRQIR